MIEVQGLSKRFGDLQVLTDISATFEKGKVNQIIGKSGSGKSVLAKCIVGLHKPEEGPCALRRTLLPRDDRAWSAATSARRSACSSKAVGPVRQRSPCWRT
jgi:ABC-type polar amino acid transport system ATPase subunit